MKRHQGYYNREYRSALIIRTAVPSGAGARGMAPSDADVPASVGDLPPGPPRLDPLPLAPSLALARLAAATTSASASHRNACCAPQHNMLYSNC
eukprot:1186745-Prorocentrum_minimum.AAC.8